MVGSFDLEVFTCADLKSPPHQLAVLLYPTDLFNEKFLTLIRNCMIALDDDHPVKKWLKLVASPDRPSSKEQIRYDFAIEMLNSPFNLITDQKVKSSVIDLITTVPRESVPEKLLVSFLYLMIGNITRSDNIIKEIISLPPRQLYAGAGSQRSIYHQLTIKNMDKIFGKLSRHPADRRTFELLTLYVLNFMNDPEIIKTVNATKTGDLSGKFDLAYVRKISPPLVSYLDLQDMSREKKNSTMRNKELWPVYQQAQWLWLFAGQEIPLNGDVIEELKRLETSDPLWLIYLLGEERLADFYFNHGGLYTISKKRSFLRSQLKGRDFMLSLLKLIELGDIDLELVDRTASFLSNE